VETLTYTAAEVATTLGYFHGGKRDGQPNADLVRRLARDGAIPPPINQKLGPKLCRWSRPEIEAYARGEWGPT
jgi:hypothetical protein